MNELDTVVLTRDLSEYCLRKGDIGAVVHCYPARAAFEVEFVTAEGKSIGVLTLNRQDIRPIGSGDILHVRELTPSPA